MQITLIQPENPYDVSYGSGLMRPLGLHLLASYLEKFGFKVEILDMRLKENRKEPFSHLIQKSDSKIFGLTGFTAARFSVVEMARCIKETYPASYVVVGGWHFTHCAADTLEHVPEIDIVVMGMGITAIISRIWTYHALYDDILILIPMIALFRIAKQGPFRGGEDVRSGILLAISCFSVLSPARLLTFPLPWDLLFKNRTDNYLVCHTGPPCQAYNLGSAKGVSLYENIENEMLTTDRHVNTRQLLRILRR